MRIFLELCGKDALQNVILATTMWDEVRSEVGISREKALRKHSCAKLLKHGVQIARHDNTRESAWMIINQIPPIRYALKIQGEMDEQPVPDTRSRKRWKLRWPVI